MRKGGWFRILAALIVLSGLSSGAGAVRSGKIYPQDAKRFLLNGAARAVRRGPSQKTRKAFEDFKARHKSGWKVRYHPRTGAVSGLSEGTTAPRRGRPEEVAASFFQESGDLLGIDPAHLKLERQHPGRLSHLFYQQTYRGLPVEFARVKVHIDEDGRVIGMDSSFVPGLSLDIKPSLSASEALGSIVRELGAIGPTPGNLVIFPDENSGEDRLAWKFSVRKNGGLWRYYIDAHTGQVLFRYDDLRRAGCGIGSTTGLVRANIFDIDPASAPARLLPLANLRVYAKTGAQANSGVTDGTGQYCAPAIGKVSASLQGPYVNVSNFIGPSAHYDNAGAGAIWSTTPSNVESAHPYRDDAITTSTINLAGVHGIVKALPIFTLLHVGAWQVDNDLNGAITQDDQLDIIDTAGNPVASYIGDRTNGGATPVNGTAIYVDEAANTPNSALLRLRLRPKQAGSGPGYSVSFSSFLAFTDPSTPGPSDIFFASTNTYKSMHSEINLFYHINAAHDYFNNTNPALGPNGPNVKIVGGAPVPNYYAAIDGPVNAITFIGPSEAGAFFSPEDNNLNFGDLNAPPNISDALGDDATVAHHEYTHYVVDKIFPMLNFGQAGAISEANADYFAATELKDSSIGKYFNASFTGQNVPLRELDCFTPLDTCKTFSPAAWSGEIHKDSIFLSQALWEIRHSAIGSLGTVQGQACADGLAFQAMLFYPESFTEYNTAIRSVDKSGLVASCGVVPGTAPGAASTWISNAFTRHGLPGGVGDAYEPNDGFGTATDISTRNALSATIFPGTDVDFYSFGAGAGDVFIKLSLPADNNGLFKAYAITLFDHNHVPIAKAEPVYDGISTVANLLCQSDDCTTTQSQVTLNYRSPIPEFYYARISGGPASGDLLNGSMSAVNSSVPYGLEFSYSPEGSLPAGIVSASFDQDTISFTATIASFTANVLFNHPTYVFAYVQLRDQSLGIISRTAACASGVPSNCPATTGTSLLSLTPGTQNTNGRVSGSVQLVPGFAASFPSLGTVYLEVFGYNIFGSTVSLGVSNAINLTTLSSNLTAYNNLFNPRKGEKTTIKYEILKPGRVNIALYTLAGSLVKTLYDGDAPAGKGSIDWYGVNSAGTIVASGVYLLHIHGPAIEKTQKILVVK